MRPATNHRRDLKSLRRSVAIAAGIFLALATAAPAKPQQAETYDLLVVNGRLVDGTGNAWIYADVAIRGNRIARITPRGGLNGAAADETIDATGMVVAPGFIDIQSHSRAQFLSGDGRVISKITQGITTEIMGEGTSNAPGADFRGPRAFGEWLSAMQEHGASPNFGSFVGGSSVRRWVMGDAQGAPNAQQLAHMRTLVRDAMIDGAFGVATALVYPPGNFATTEELIAMAAEMSPYGGVYISHLRSEADTFLEAIDEAIRIGREGGVAVEIFHLKAAGHRNWYKADLAIARIEAARSEGLDIQANMYPYTAGSTGLNACMPPWASADGKLFDNLTDPGMRATIRDEILNQKTVWENFCALTGADGVLILRLRNEENRQYAGMYLAEIAAAMGKEWVDALIDLIVSEEGDPSTIYFMMSEENVALQLAQPWMKFGTDAGGADPARSGALTHPRAYGTFPRILGKYVREERVMPLEEAIRKMTSAVANRLSIRDRGLLREGYFADLVLFDPATIGDVATYEQPHQVSLGVRWVLVNGIVVVREGEHTGALPGHIVRGPGYVPQ
jgi:dihydroorotase/N-acyl-D-amino-acid deacylase